MQRIKIDLIFGIVLTITGLVLTGILVYYLFFEGHMDDANYFNIGAVCGLAATFIYSGARLLHIEIKLLKGER